MYLRKWCSPIVTPVPATGQTCWLLWANWNDMLKIFPGPSSRAARIYACLWTNPPLSNPEWLDWRSYPSAQQIFNLPSLFWRKEELQSKKPQSTPHQAAVATRFCKKCECHGSYPWTYLCLSCPDRQRKSHPSTRREVFQMLQKGTHEPGLPG